MALNRMQESWIRTLRERDLSKYTLDFGDILILDLKSQVDKLEATIADLEMFIKELQEKE